MTIRDDSAARGATTADSWRHIEALLDQSWTALQRAVSQQQFAAR